MGSATGTFIFSSILLTQLQKEVIVGTLLGNASIERRKPTHNARILFEQFYPNHEAYPLSLTAQRAEI